ncbi:MAG: response regulator [Pseudomonadales bacterium]|nr:response regulator [Pseudomonadales bacterium]
MTHLFKKLFKKLNDHVKRKGFQQQLSFTFIVSFLGFSIFITLCSALFVQQLVGDNFKKQGLAITELFANQSSLALAYASKENAVEVSARALELPSVMQVKIFDTHQKLFYQQTDSENRTVVKEQETQAVAIVFEGDSVRLHSETFDYWMFTAPVSIGDDAHEDSPYSDDVSEKLYLGYVRVIISKAALHTMVKKMIIGIASVAVVILTLMLLLQRKLIVQLTKPLYKLIDAMDDRSHNAHRESLHTYGAPEWQQIYKAFNRMMIAIQDQEHEIKKARDEALETARLKSEFAANISHELRTPMNGILGMMELLSCMELDKGAKDYVELAKNSGEQLHHLVNDILDFSKLDAGHMQLNESNFDLLLLIEDLMAVHAHSLQAKDLHLSSVFPADLPTTVIGDQTRLRQLLNNLIGNAVKFTESGHVCVEVQVVNAEHEKANSALHLRLIISDTGIGIPAQYHESIFAPYSQQDGSTNRKFGGTGLGLAICKGIVKLMSGSIVVESQAGQGSQFILDLPFSSVLIESEAEPMLAPAEAEALYGVIFSRKSCIQKSLACRLTRLNIAHIISEDLEQLPSLLAAKSRQHIVLLVDVQGIDRAALDASLSVIKTLQKLTVVELHSAGNKLIKDQTVEMLASVDQVLKVPVRSDRLKELMQQELPQINHGATDKPLKLVCAVTDIVPIKIRDARILVVEDNIVNQKVALGMLKKLGIAADIANDGSEAIQAIGNQNYDLIFMDCQMPVIDGYQATKIIRDMSGFGKIPIVALTANTSVEDISRCKDSGMNDYISKPIRLKLLEGVLMRWIPDYVEEEANLN